MGGHEFEPHGMLISCNYGAHVQAQIRLPLRWGVKAQA